MTLSAENILEMQKVDVNTVDIDTLTDLNDIEISTNKSMSFKLNQFAEQTQNLFVNRVNDYVVKVSYAKTEVSINDKMKQYMMRLAEINF